MLVFNEHSNDIGDWCPFSGEELPADQGKDKRCPQGCRASRIVEDDGN